MLFSPVYIEAHPRRIAAHAAPCISSNPFPSCSFRTLSSHFRATVSSNSFEIKRFRTLCKIPGIGYPFSPLVTHHSPLFMYPFSFQSLVVPSSPLSSHRTLCIPFISFSLRTLSFATGGYTPLPQFYFPLLLAPEPLEVLPESFDPAGETPAFHQSRVTVSLPRTLAPKTPRCQNALGRSSNATLGNISAPPGV
jgi:hypothetical protein